MVHYQAGTSPMAVSGATGTGPKRVCFLPRVGVSSSVCVSEHPAPLGSGGTVFLWHEVPELP